MFIILPTVSSWRLQLPEHAARMSCFKMSVYSMYCNHIFDNGQLFLQDLQLPELIIAQRIELYFLLPILDLS